MRLSVVAVDMLTPHIKAIRLADPDGGALPAFEPGAHVDIDLPLGQTTVRRKYSLVSDPADRFHYRIAVKRSVMGRGGSTYLHDAVQPGTMLEVGAPLNEFRLRAGAAHHILIAGGIGITPLLGMALKAQREGLSYELHYAAASADEMAFRAGVSALSRARLYFSRDGAGERLDIGAVLHAHAGNPDVHLYVCGPGRLIDAARWRAQEAGLPGRHVHFESFGPAWQPDDRTVQLMLADSGIALSVTPGTTLLEAMEDAGAWIPSECRRGECGACITGFSGGTPRHRDNCLSEAQRTQVFCPCVSWAEGDTVLTLQA